MQVAILDRRGFDRSALAALCSEDDRLTVVLTGGDATAVVRALRVDRESVVLVGRTLLREDGPATIALLRRSPADPRVVVVGLGGEDSLMLEAVRVGADGFLERDGDSQGQLAAIHGKWGAVPRWDSNGHTVRQAS